MLTVLVYLPCPIGVSYQDVFITGSVSVKQRQSVIAVLFKCEHVPFWTSRIFTHSMSKHVMCNYAVAQTHKMCHLIFELTVCSPCTMEEE